MRRAEARALCNGISDCAQANWPALTGREKRVRRELLPRRLRSGARGRDEIDGDDRNVEALAVEIRDLDNDDPDRHAIPLLAGNLGIGDWIGSKGFRAFRFKPWNRRSCLSNCKIIGPVLHLVSSSSGPIFGFGPLRAPFKPWFLSDRNMPRL